MTTEQQLQAIAEAQKKLDQRKAKLLAKKVALNKDSLGIQASVEAVQAAADLNKVSVAEILKFVAKTKRTGLKFESVTRRKRGPNKPKQDTSVATKV
jgi:hypothetical protein